MNYTGNLELDIYTRTIEKIASMEKEAGPLLRGLARSAQRNMTKTRGGIIPSANKVAPVVTDLGRQAAAHPVDNIVVPALKGYLGSGLVNGPKPKMLRAGINKISKVPGLGWTSYVNKGMDWLDRFGRQNIPNNPVSKTINDIGRGVASYDDYLGWGTPVALWGGNFLGNFLA